MIKNTYPLINMPETGKHIKFLLKAKGISVRELADFMGFEQPQAVYKWLRGDSLPTVDNLYALSVVLSTPMQDILVGDAPTEQKIHKWEDRAA